jgi:hypothetical protein
LDASPNFGNAAHRTLDSVARRFILVGRFGRQV